MHWRCVVNVTIVAQAEGDMGTNAFEVTAEDDLPVGDCDRGCLFKVVIDIFTFSAFFLTLLLLSFGLGIVNTEICLF